jgi:hypothetical protein
MHWEEHQWIFATSMVLPTQKVLSGWLIPTSLRSMASADLASAGTAMTANIAAAARRSVENFLVLP